MTTLAAQDELAGPATQCGRFGALSATPARRGREEHLGTVLLGQETSWCISYGVREIDCCAELSREVTRSSRRTFIALDSSVWTFATRRCAERTLDYVDLSEANLRWAELRDANLHGAYLTGARFGGADPRSANFNGAYAIATSFGDALLDDANATGVLYDQATSWPSGIEPLKGDIGLWHGR